MRQVNTNAIGNPFHHSNSESGASTGTSVPGVAAVRGDHTQQATGATPLNPRNNDSTRRLIVFMLAAAAASRALAVGAPLTVTCLLYTSPSPRDRS